MPSVARRRRKAAPENESDEEPTQSTQRRQRVPSEDEEDEGDREEDGGEEEMDVDEDADNQDQLVKKLVRYALACEYQRIPIRRNGISEKVIAKQRGAFKRTFEAAQKQLRHKFGMEMVELPVREKVTMKDRRSQKNTGGQKTSSYILCSTLPVQYRIPEIMPPSLVGDEAEEAAYIGLYTFIVAIIALSPQGVISDEKFSKHLDRVNAGTNMPMDKTEAVVARMIKQNYIFKTVERTEIEETTEWRVGARGKVEIGNRGIEGLVRAVYGEDAPDDLTKRLQRSLGIEVAQPDEDGEEEEDELQQVIEPESSRRISARRR